MITKVQYYLLFIPIYLILAHLTQGRWHFYVWATIAGIGLSNLVMSLIWEE